MNILALDLGKSTGWASQKRAVRLGTRDFTDVWNDRGRLGYALHNWLADMVLDVKPEIIAFEQVGGIGAAKITGIGMAQIVETVCYAHEIQRFMMPTSTWRKAIVGSGRAKDPDVLAWCSKNGFHPQNNHEADALCIMTYALEQQRLAA